MRHQWDTEMEGGYMPWNYLGETKGSRTNAIQHKDLNYYLAIRDIVTSNPYFNELFQRDPSLEQTFGLNLASEGFTSKYAIHKWQTSIVDEENEQHEYTLLLPQFLRNPVLLNQTIETIVGKNKDITSDAKKCIKQTIQDLRALCVTDNAPIIYSVKRSQRNKAINEASGLSDAHYPTAQYAIGMWLCTKGINYFFNPANYGHPDWGEHKSNFIEMLSKLQARTASEDESKQACMERLQTSLTGIVHYADFIAQRTLEKQKPAAAIAKLQTACQSVALPESAAEHMKKILVPEVANQSIPLEDYIANKAPKGTKIAGNRAVNGAMQHMLKAMDDSSKEVTYSLTEQMSHTQAVQALEDQGREHSNRKSDSSESRAITEHKSIAVTQPYDVMFDIIKNALQKCIEKHYLYNDQENLPELSSKFNELYHNLKKTSEATQTLAPAASLLTTLGTLGLYFENIPMLEALVCTTTILNFTATNLLTSISHIESLLHTYEQYDAEAGRKYSQGYIKNADSVIKTGLRSLKETAQVILSRSEETKATISTLFVMEDGSDVPTIVDEVRQDLGEIMKSCRSATEHLTDEQLAELQSLTDKNLSEALGARHQNPLKMILDVPGSRTLVAMSGSSRLSRSRSTQDRQIGHPPARQRRVASQGQESRLEDRPGQKISGGGGVQAKQESRKVKDGVIESKIADESDDERERRKSGTGSEETSEIIYSQTDANIDAGITALAALYDKKHTQTFATIQQDGTVANGGVLDEAEIALLLIAKHPELTVPTSVAINELISELKITLIPNKAKTNRDPHRIEQTDYRKFAIPFSIKKDLDRQTIANCFYAAKDESHNKNVREMNGWTWWYQGKERINNAGKTAALISRDITEKNWDSFNNLQDAEGLLKILRKETESYYSEKLHPLVYNYLIKIISLAKNLEGLDGELSISNKVQDYFKGQTYLTAQTKDAQKGLIAALLTQQPDGWDNLPYDFKKHYIKKLSIILQFILRGGKQNLSAHLGLNPDTEDKDLAENIIGWLSHKDDGRLERVIATVIELKGFRYGLANIVNNYYLASDDKSEDFSTDLQAKSFWEILTNLKYQSIEKENSQELIIQHIQSATNHRDNLREDKNIEHLADMFLGQSSTIQYKIYQWQRQIDNMNRHIDALEIIKSTRAVQFAIHSAAPKDQRLVEIILNRILYNSVFSSNTDEVLKLINCLNDNIDLTKLKIDPKLQLFKILYDFLKDPTNIQLSAKIGARELADLYGILSEEFLKQRLIPKDKDIHNIASIVTGIMREDEFRDHIKTIKSIIKQKLTFESLSIIANLYTTEKNNRPSFRAPSPEELRERYNTSNSAPPTDGEGANEKRIIRVIDAYIKELRTFTETDQIMRILSGQGILVADNMISSLTDEAIENLESELLSIGHSVTESEIKSMLCAAVTAATLATSTQQPTETNAPDLNNAIQMAKTIAQREDASDDDKKAASLLLFSAMKELMPSNVAASDEDTHDQSGQIETKEPEEEVNTQDDVAQPTSASVTAASLDILQKRLQSKYEEAQHRNQARLSHPEEKEGDNDIESTDSIHAAFSESQNQIAQWKDFLKQEYGEAINDANSQLNSADQLIEDALRSYTSSLDDDNSSLPTLTGTLKANKQQVINLFAKGNIDQYFEKCHDRGFTLSNGLKKRIKQLAYDCSSNPLNFLRKSASNRLLRASKILVLIGFIEKAILKKTERLIKDPNDPTSVEDIFSDLICASSDPNETSPELKAAHAILNRTRGRIVHDGTGARSRSMISGLRAQANEYRGQKQQSEQPQKSLAEESKIRFFSPQTAMSRNNSSVNIRAGLDERDDLRADAITRPNQPVVVRNNLPGQTSTTDIEQKEGERTGVPTI